MSKLLIAAVMGIMLSACSSYTTPPEPVGPKIPVNSHAVTTQLSAENDVAMPQLQAPGTALLNDELTDAAQMLDAGSTPATARGLKDIEAKTFRK